MSFVSFLRENARFLSAGALLTLISCFGQTFFISIFGGEIRAEFGLSNARWGTIYGIGTLCSAILMIWAGGLSDQMRVRHLGALVMVGLAAACLAMAVSPFVWLLPFVIFALRFAGQGMLSHLAVVAMARWFVAARGRALSIASLGFAAGEALLPMIMVSLMSVLHWRVIWLCCAGIALLLIPVLSKLLQQERTPAAAAAETHAAGLMGRHWSRPDVLKHWLFWAMVPMVMVPSTFITALFFQQVHLAEVKGWSHAEFVALIPVFTIGTIVFALVMGWIMDQLGAFRLIPFYQVPLAVGFYLLGGAESQAAGALALVFLSMTQGGQSTIANAFWAEIYGTRHLGAIKALAAALMVLGSAAGPVVTGVLIDLGVDFDQQMTGIALFILLASGLGGVAVFRAQRAAATHQA